MAAEPYGPDYDLGSRSPPLKRQIIDYCLTPDYMSPAERSTTPDSSRYDNPRKLRRPRDQPSEGDETLIDALGNYNYPDVAKRAGREVLPQSDDSDIGGSFEETSDSSNSTQPPHEEGPSRSIDSKTRRIFKDDIWDNRLWEEMKSRNVRLTIVLDLATDPF